MISLYQKYQSLKDKRKQAKTQVKKHRINLQQEEKQLKQKVSNFQPHSSSSLIKPNQNSRSNQKLQQPQKYDDKTKNMDDKTTKQQKTQLQIIKITTDYNSNTNKKTGCFYLDKTCTTIKNYFTVVLLILDEISDLWYLIMKWDTFATQELRSLVLFFTIYLPVALTFNYIILDIVEGVKHCSRDFWSTKTLFYLLSVLINPLCVIIKAYQLLTKLIRSQIQQKDEFEKELNIYQQFLLTTNQPIKQPKGTEVQKSTYNPQDITLYILYLIFLNGLIESGPQIIFQSRNNYMNGEWDSLALFSLATSILVILMSFVQIISDIAKQVRQNQDQQSCINSCCDNTFKTEDFRLVFCYLVGGIGGGVVAFRYAQFYSHSSAFFGILTGVGCIVLGYILSLIIEKYCHFYNKKKLGTQQQFHLSVKAK